MTFVYKEFVKQPNNLLLRCVQFAAQPSQGLGLSGKESTFLANNRIAETKATTSDWSSSDYLVVKFLPPWDAIISDLAKQMVEYKPPSVGL